MTPTLIFDYYCRIMKVSIIGTGRVGLALGASLAESGHFVLFTDKDLQKLKNLSQGHIPFYEPGLKIRLRKNKERLKWVEDPDIVTASKVIFLTLNPTITSKGDFDLSGVKDWTLKIIHNTRKEKLLILKSTLPPGTNRHLQSLAIKSGVPLHIITCPEFLRQGQALKDIQYPARIVIASHSSSINKKTARLYKTFSHGPVIFTTPETAEIGKLASNSFLTLKISFINLMANLMENLNRKQSNGKFFNTKNRNANMNDLKAILSLDPRIGGHFLQSGLGFGGSCLPKDLTHLILQGQKTEVSMKLLKEVEILNRQRVDHFFHKIKQHSKNLKNKTYAVWGISFKQGTDDLRFSPALLLAERLLKAGSKLAVFDPLFVKKKEAIISFLSTKLSLKTQDSKKTVTSTLKTSSTHKLHRAKSIAYLKTNFIFHNTPLSALKSAHGLIIGTDWKGIKKIPLKDIKKHLKEPFIVDGRAVFNVKELQKEGFDFYQSGIFSGNQSSF